ncbi:MAG: cell division protein FtsZ [Methanomassiliicoccales archaeon]|nr:MAG: cell division protein FtsZ [Methanomassiliicoccales archaeon]
MGSSYGGEASDYDIHRLKILVVGCGGAGCNSIHRLNKIGIEGADTLAINTDAISLKATCAKNRLLIGAEYTKGRGAGGRVDVGETCAMNAGGIIDQTLRDVDLCFIIVGMGGGTGTGAAPIVAETAKRNGAVVISIATLPFHIEGGVRKSNALKGLRRLSESSDTLLVLDNNRLIEICGNIPFNQALGVMDQLIAELIRGIVDALTKPSLINLDFADLKTVISHGGVSTILYAENADPDGVVNDAINNPLLDIDIKGGTGALVHLSGGSTLTLRKAYKVFQGITGHLDPDANIKFGVRIEDDNESTIRLIAVITGITDIPDEPASGPEMTRDLSVLLKKYGR